jgi:hypothetical protein
LSDREFILASARLARVAPEEWVKFLDALTGYTEDRIVECIQSQSDMLPVAQGRAQSLLKLRQTLEDCLKIADDIMSKAQPSARKP